MKFKGYEWRQNKELNKLIYNAWHTALFIWQKRLPNLQDVLLKGKEETQEPQDLESKTMGILARMGVQVIDEAGDPIA